jgi:hypothetical protein
MYVFTCPVDIRKDVGSKSAWLTSLNIKYSLEVNKRYKRKKILITVLLPAYHKPWNTASSCEPIKIKYAMGHAYYKRQYY